MPPSALHSSFKKLNPQEISIMASKKNRYPKDQDPGSPRGSEKLRLVIGDTNPAYLPLFNDSSDSASSESDEYGGSGRHP
jgi:hypothetical protein